MIRFVNACLDSSTGREVTYLDNKYDVGATIIYITSKFAKYYNENILDTLGDQIQNYIEQIKSFVVPLCIYYVITKAQYAQNEQSLRDTNSTNCLIF
jgi:hypothetical protein